MANVEGMSGFDLRAVVSDIASRLPLWIGKIYQYDAKSLGFRLNGEDRARYQMFVEAGRRAHFVEALPTAPENPTGYAMFLRKHIAGGKILEIRQFGLQRVFSCAIGKKSGTYHLVFELFGEGNVVLCDEEWTIIKPLWHHRFRDRELVPGARYVHGGASEHDPGPDTFSRMLQESDRDLVRTLAVDMMLGGRYAEEVCRRAGADKSAAANAADGSAVYEAFADLLDEIEHRTRPVITASGCWPVIPADETAVAEFGTFHEALAAYYPLTKREMTKEKSAPPLSREEMIRKHQREAIINFDARIIGLERKVELIYEHYALVGEVIAALESARQTRSWHEISHILKKSDLPIAKSVVSVNPAEASVDLDLGERVTIFVDDTVEVNAGRYFEQIKKMKRKKAGAQAALERPFHEKKETKQVKGAGKRRWFHRFRWFFTSDGVMVVGGRDASQNEELVKRYMEGADTFIHADVHGGSVVIVKGHTGAMEEAAGFAASYSNAWKSGHGSADVYAAKPGQVSKTAPSGEYVARGAFMVRGERDYFRNVPLEIAIGMQTEPAPMVIGGPPAAVSGRAKCWVVLRPGRFAPNDIARKVLKALRECLPEEEWRALRYVLNTDAIAAFVPPGTSDMVEMHEG